MKQFKRIISFVIAMVMLVSMFTVAIVSTSAATQDYILGDVDQNGKVEVMDATMVQRHLVSMGVKIEADTVTFAAADVNRDGAITIFDATIIQRYLAGLDLMGHPVGDAFTFGEPDPTEPETPEETEEPETPEVTEPETPEVTEPETPEVTEPETPEVTEPETPEVTEPETPEVTEPETPEVTEPETPEVTEPETPEVTEPETEEPTDPVIDAGYYMVGTFNGVDCWSADTLSLDRKFAENPDVAGEYILYWTFVGGDELKVAHFDGTTIDALYKVEAEPTYKIGATSDKTGYCSVKFNPQGNEDWSYTYFTVKRAEVPVDPTDEPTVEETDEPTVEETEESTGLEVGYYLVGSFNGVDCWSVDALTSDRMLKANPSVAGEYMIDWTFVGGDELKVAHFDGEKFDKWFNDGGDNYKIGATSNKVGLCTVYFRPDGNTEWSYNFFTVQPKTVEETEEPTVEETEEPTVEETEEPTVEETEEPTVEETEESTGLEVGYYLVGSFNGVDCWSVDALTSDRMLKANPSVAGEYMIDWTFVGGDELKVAHFDGEKFDKWFNDGGDNYKIGATSNKVGLCTVYFRPDGNTEWSYNFFTVQPKTVEETEEPTVEETEEPTVEETEEPTVEETEEPTVEETEEPTVEETEEPTVEETEESTGLEVGYYLVGSFNGVDCWSVDALTSDRMLKANPSVAGEYMIDWTFVGGDELKVAHFDGEKFDKWFNDGGDNYKIGATSNKVGLCTVYFRPDGNTEWSYNFFTVQPKTVEETEEPTVEETEEPTVEETEEPTVEETEEPTVEETEEPTVEETEEPTVEETEEPTVEETEESTGLEAGYYLVGSFNGVDCWSVDSLTADRMLKANPSVAGEYMIDWTFVGGDELKVAHFDGEKFDKWFNDGGDNYKIGATSNKVGLCTVYFRPDGNTEWSYNFFTVQPKTVEETEEPTVEETEEPTVEETEEPTVEETEEPTVEETEEPTVEETEEPTVEETEEPTVEETEEPTVEETEEPTVEETEEPTVEETEESTGLEAGYYLVGTLNGVDCWTVDALTADRMLKENSKLAGEYMLDWTFVGGDELKVAHFDGEKFDKWFNDGGDNYKIGVDSNKVGACTIYFRPEGNTEWSYNFFTVQPKTVDETEEPTVEETEEPTVEETEEPTVEETEEPTDAPTVYNAYFVNSGNWSKVNAYAWSPANAAWPGVAMTKTADVAPNGADVYTISFKTNYANIIFNDGSSQTSDLEFEANKYYDFATSKWYDKLEDIPSTQPTGYTVYCVNSKSWSKVNAYVWGPNGTSWPGSTMTKTGEKSSKGYDIYSYTFAQEHTNVIFNNGSGTQTSDLTFQAGQYYDLSTNKWYADASTI